MTPSNKKSLIQGAVVLAAALVVFFYIMMFSCTINAGMWWATIVPTVGIAYAVYSFVKKYYPNDKVQK